MKLQKSILIGILIAVIAGGVYFLYSQDGYPAIIRVGLGQTASGLDVTLTPLAVIQDNRCPVDVQCIVAGTVRVRVKIQSGLGTSVMVFEPEKPITTEAEQITLKDASPQPKAGVKIKDSEYVFQFEIIKRQKMGQSL